jgi:hypothetical protein
VQQRRPRTAVSKAGELFQRLAYRLGAGPAEEGFGGPAPAEHVTLRRKDEHDLRRLVDDQGQQLLRAQRDSHETS